MTLSTETRRNVRWVLWFALAAYAVLLTKRFLPVHAQVIEPSTVILSQVVTDTTGATHEAGTTVYATRSDGAVARLYSAPPNAPSYAGRVVRFPTGERDYILDGRQIKSSTLMPQYSVAAAVRMPSARCLQNGDTDEGTEQIGAYRAQKVFRGLVTTWFALDYGCAIVKERWEFKDGQVSQKNLVTLMQGEPSPSLFEVGKGLAEVAASNVLLGPNEKPTVKTDLIDADYAKQHAALMAKGNLPH